MKPIISTLLGLGAIAMFFAVSRLLQRMRGPRDPYERDIERLVLTGRSRLKLVRGGRG